ncbi:uncharacterized protein LOC108667310 isoform X2 [Hyalella azteca]|uniref:Uncharacterized protein LOC108667310 isoform X2 n=1 Tax=Hyalella azteca TaxID=294128 RepID=A0A8B7N7E5_HYAAZ|nr:uncharacterized protein LOC108667310 isoform X2 [Hyalella azteca]
MGNEFRENGYQTHGDSEGPAKTHADNLILPLSTDQCFSKKGEQMADGITARSTNDVIKEKFSEFGLSCSHSRDACSSCSANEVMSSLESHNCVKQEPSHSYEGNHGYMSPSLEPIPENQVWSTHVDGPRPSENNDAQDGFPAMQYYADENFKDKKDNPSESDLTPFHAAANKFCCDAANNLNASENFQDPSSLSQFDTEKSKAEDCLREVTTLHHDGSKTKSFDSPSWDKVSFLNVNLNLNQPNLKISVPNFPALDHLGSFHWKSPNDKPGMPSRIATHNEVSSRCQSCHCNADAGDDIEKEKLKTGGIIYESNIKVAPKYKPHPDVDRGYAWVVAVGVLISFGILSGLLFTCSLYYTEMLKEFGESRSYTAWIGSLVNGFFLLGSMASSALIQKYSCRVAAMLGSLVMTGGYLASAFAPTLQTVFITYGVITASGMNLVFSAAVLVLAQYFDKRHCLATTIAMLGNGLGVLVLSQVMEQVIMAYGWRLSFIVCAGISLQLCVAGALFCPLPPSALLQPPSEDAENPRTSDHRIVSENESSENEDNCGKKVAKNDSKKRRKARERNSHRICHHPYYRTELLDKSFSSLVLSPQAGYLSHSLASLDRRSSSVNTCRHHYNHSASCGHRSKSRLARHPDDEFTRNDSLLSRGSSFLPAFFRRSQFSFSSKLSSAQVSLAARSSQHSRISLKDSRLDLMFQGIKSNPHSFSLRLPTSSQLEETEKLCSKLDDLLEEEKTSSSEDGSKEKLRHGESNSCSLQLASEKCELMNEKCYLEQRSSSKIESEKMDGVLTTESIAHNNVPDKVNTSEKKASFLISGGDSEDDDGDYGSDDTESASSDVGSVTVRSETLIARLKKNFRSLRTSCTPFCFSTDAVFSNPSVWCFAFSYFFCYLGTLTIYVIFTDFARNAGVGSFSSTAMSAAGIGDIIGRFCGGMLAVGKVGNTTVLYAISMLLSAGLLGLFHFISNGLVFVATMACYGIMFGAQNMYFAITPKILFGRQSLAQVFGLTVFLAGIGALVGSPLAGLIIDFSGGYSLVLLSEITCCVIGSCLMFFCYLRKRREETCNRKEIENDGHPDGISSNLESLKMRNSKLNDNRCQLITGRSRVRRKSLQVPRGDCAACASRHLNSDISLQSSAADGAKIPNLVRGRKVCCSRTLVDLRRSVTSLPPPHLQTRACAHSLKRTNTYDVIHHGAPMHGATLFHVTGGGGRRYTMSSTQPFHHKKKSPSLYEEVLGKTFDLRQNSCLRDHELGSRPEKASEIG